MRNRIRTLFIVFAVLLMLTASSGSVLLADISQPKQGLDVPSDVKWDSKLGCYVSSDFYELQSEAGPSVPQVNETVITTLFKQMEAKLKGLFMDDKSTALDQAFKKYDQEWRKHPSPKGYYDPRDDVGMPVLINLGIKELPTMLDRIQQDPERGGILMYAVQEMTSIKPVALVDASDAGRKAWMVSFNGLIKNAPDVVHQSTLALQKNPKDEQALQEIYELGLFAAPYVLDEAVQGNTAALTSLDRIVGGKGNAQLKNGTENWLTWGVSHAEDMNVLKTLVKNSNK